MEVKQYEDEFNSLLVKLKDNGAPDIFWQYGFAMPKMIKEDALLFVGLNPSFIQGGDPKSHFYDVAQDAQGYFAKFAEIAKSCGDDITWEHLDLLPIRHTNQGNVVKKIVIMHRGIINDYLKQVSKKLLENSKPKAVIVVNATARLLLGKDQHENRHGKLINVWMGYDFRFDDSNGACYVQNADALKDIPFFFTGMLSGQRALDLGSFERLKWHVAKVVKGELK